jgi:hypothetical protein
MRTGDGSIEVDDDDGESDETSGAKAAAVKIQGVEGAENNKRDQRWYGRGYG